VAGVPPDPRAEALLHLAWVRGAVGRFPCGEGGGATPVTAVPGAAATARVPGPGAVAPGRSEPAVLAAAVEPEAAPEPGAGADPGHDEALDRLRAEAWDRLRAEALVCRRCALCETRSSVVFGEGSRRPRLVVVGEAPGADEDASGRPFVGKAGQLLTRMLAAIGLARDDVYIANVLKCRPPGNRPPAPDEVAMCRPYLAEQLRLLDPELILVLGNHAAHAILSVDRGISSLRGRIHRAPDGRAVLPTFHPSYLLRNPAAKREAWLDLQLVARTLGLTVPSRTSDTAPEPESAAGDDVG